MAGKEDVKKAIRKLGDDPGAVQSLIDAGKPGRKSGLTGKGVPNLDRKEVADEIKRLLTESQPTGTGASPERVVEWAGVVATMAAAALV